MSTVLTRSTETPRSGRLSGPSLRTYVVRPPLAVRVLTAPVLGLLLISVVRDGGLSASTSYTLALACVYGVVVLAVSLLAGWGGVWSVGHPALVAVGAYSAAWGSTHGWGLELTVLVSMAIAAACGAFIGFAGARFSILYIALLTLAFNLVALELAGRLVHITGGDQGVAASPLPSTLFPGGIVSTTDTLTAPIAVLAVLLAVTVLVRRSALRMRLLAAKSGPLVSRTVAIAPEAQVALAFAASGAVASLAGVLLAELTGFVSPEPFSLTLAINVIAAAVLGGIGSTTGAVVGGAFMAWSPNIADTLGVSTPVLQGLVLIVLLIFLPQGVIPSLARLLQRALGRPAPTGGTAGESAAAPPVDHVRTGPPPGKDLLDVRDLGVRFAGLVALQDVSLSVRRGEVLGIIGPNGAGKTTLINALSGIALGAKVTGSVLLQSEDLRHVRSTRRRSRGLARTFQHAELFSELTVLENVLCTRRTATRERRREVQQLLAEAGVATVQDSLPEDLSFGLRKRVDLARAIAEQPKLLLMDEPFGGLDAGEREITRSLIQELSARGTTILIVDHVLDELFAVANRVVAFDFGTPIASGDPHAVLHDDRVRASYLGDGAPVRTGDRSSAEAAAELVALDDVQFHYGGVPALRGVDLRLRAGQVLGVVGANGAGKSTLGRVLGGLEPPSAGARTATGFEARALRCSVVPEGRALFRTLSIRENLEVAAYGVGLRGPQGRAAVEEMVRWLPERLHDRSHVAAGSLSGGEQQMLAIARGLIGSPDVLVLDEPALGLAPLLVDEVYRRIATLAEQGLTVVLLEQLLARAAGVCDEILVLRDGRIVGHGRADDQAFIARAEHAYFGDAAADLLDEPAS